MRYFAAILTITALLFAACGKTQSCIDLEKQDLSIFCQPIVDPQCGCDDVTYQNPCEAERYGVRAYIGGPCL